MRILPLVWAAAALLLAGSSVVASAQPVQRTKAGTITGIDKIHDQVRLSGKVCMREHDHQGEAEMPSHKGAEAAAIRRWRIFTADEYGTAWGNYNLAVAKTMSCKSAAGRWVCRVSARPCRPAKL